MPMQAWKARILIGGKTPSVEVQIQANNSSDAKKLLVAQYGKDTKFFSGPSRA